MLTIIALYILLLMLSEKKVNDVIACASEIRRILLESSGEQSNIDKALKRVCLFAKSRSAIFFNTDGEEYSYILPEFKEDLLAGQERKYFMAELLRYATEFHQLKTSSVNILCIKPDEHMLKTNPSFYKLLNEHKIKEIDFSATINNTNHVTILAVINAKRSNLARRLAEKISACFSMALYNRNYLNKTKLAATTDALTGASNRVAYKNDLIKFNEEKALDFSCIYVDVNELHFINNKYGHAVGDEMLIYIANTLKEVFFGHNVYRMGGDEFLVFCQNTEHDVVKKSIEVFEEQLKPKKYHVAIGLAYRTQNTNTEEMVKEAEVRMYEEKAKYYQNKENQPETLASGKEFIQVETGILEIDTMISVLKEKYNGIYRVSLDTDKASPILMPTYLNYKENEEHFSDLFTQYVNESVESEHHRAVMSFLNYEAIKNQLKNGIIPKITYKKNDGETVILTVYKIGDSTESVSDTLWFFAKE